MIIRNVTIGSDPELFIYNTKTNKVVSSIGLIPGEKGNAYRSKDMPEGFGLQIDNILGEFNIPPCTTEKEFIDNINYMKDYIRNFVKKQNPDLDILNVASMLVDEDQLQSDEAKLFGCSVDYNAYTEDANPKPCGETTNLRSAGVHIHIGYDNYNTATSIELVKYLDMYLGIPSVIYDTDTRRRSLYGKAGCFRLTSYGLEYRVLSGAFIKDDDMLDFVWNGVQNAIFAYNNETNRISEELVQKVINSSDVENAKLLIKTYNLI